MQSDDIIDHNVEDNTENNEGEIEEIPRHV